MDGKGSAKKSGGYIIIQYNSAVVLSFTFLSLAVLLLGVLTKGNSTYFMFTAYKTSWSDPLTYIRLITHVFGHASFEHYFANFLIILLIGPMIEEKYGSKTLLCLMLLTAVITGLVHMVFFSTGLLGASGIVFMMILLSSYANFERGKIPLTLILVILAFIGKEAAMGFVANNNVSYLTHVIGGAIGGVCGYFISVGGKKKAEKPEKIAVVTDAPLVDTAPKEE